MADRKSILLRLDPAVHDALAGWAGAELRSTNAQIEYLLREALRAAGRLPDEAKKMRGPGRPRRQKDQRTTEDQPTTKDQPATEDLPAAED
jgi:hypothetical protein